MRYVTPEQARGLQIIVRREGVADEDAPRAVRLILRELDLEVKQPHRHVCSACSKICCGGSLDGNKTFTHDRCNHAGCKCPCGEGKMIPVVED